MKDLAQELKFARGWRTLKEVAGVIGISSSTLSRVESGKIPSLSTLTKICRWLGADPDSFLGVSLQSTALTPDGRARLNKDFMSYSPYGNQVIRYNRIRDEAKKLAAIILEKTPGSRKQSLALTNLEQAMFWAHAAIARNEGIEDENRS